MKWLEATVVWRWQVLGVSLLYSGGIPVLYLFASFSFATNFIVDKVRKDQTPYFRFKRKGNDKMDPALYENFLAIPSSRKVQNLSFHICLPESKKPDRLHKPCTLKLAPLSPKHDTTRSRDPDGCLISSRLFPS